MAVSNNMFEFTLRYREYMAAYVALPESGAAYWAVADGMTASCLNS
jgi:hypothetical protein